MSQEKLNRLAIFSIEQDLLENIKYKSLISKFVAETVYRVIFQWFFFFLNKRLYFFFYTVLGLIILRAGPANTCLPVSLFFSSSSSSEIGYYVGLSLMVNRVCWMDEQSKCGVSHAMISVLRKWSQNNLSTITTLTLWSWHFLSGYHSFHHSPLLDPFAFPTN